ncbi:MAG TPA: response regulator [Kofleriaceae bacterium]|nr:response regulator [Kofleriaceae bacterium]
MIPVNRRILIVDDTRAIHDDYQKILQPRRNALADLEAELFGSGDMKMRDVAFELTSAYQGEEGVEHVRAAGAAGEPFALALVDMRMPPGIDGVQTIERMWAIDPDLQVVICTAYSDASWDEIVQRFGTTDRLLILKKPFDPAEVCQLALSLTEKWRLAMQARGRLAELTASRAELAASLALAQAVQDATGDGILVVGLDHEVKTTNRRYLEMWNVPPAVRATGSARDLLLNAVKQVHDAEAFESRIHHLYARPDDSSTDEIALRDGRVFERWSSPVKSSSGEPLGRLWRFRDISERRAIERERAVVTERMASMGRLAAAVGHEINNPLMYAFGNVENLLGRVHAGELPSRGELLEVLPDVQDGLDRIRVIVRDLQTLSRSDDAEGEVSLEQVAEQAIQIAHVESRHRAVLHRSYEPAPMVRGNRTRLGQVALNLLINAAQAIPDGKSASNRIEVRVRATATHSILEIADTGVGIAPEHIERIFDPFFTTKAVGIGTGLGLAVSREIVVGYGGAIDVESELGVGTRMRVSLPHAVAAVARTRTATVVPSPRPKARRAKVLVIDDEPLLARAIERGLSAHHQVVVASRARDALERISHGETFDTILCDLMMPDVSGIDVHAYLEREHPALVPRVVFMTGGAFTASAKQFLHDIPNEHIVKPFSISEILKIVERQLQAAS